MLCSRLSTTLLLAATCLFMTAGFSVNALSTPISACGNAYSCARVRACEHSFAHLQCDEGQVISVYSANYGRRVRTICSYGRPHSQVQNVHCSRPTNQVAQSCNGRSSCAVKASNSIFGDPCYGTFKYLEVFYTCQTRIIACEHSVANLQCGEGQVISVYSANYGRRDRTICSHRRPDYQIRNVHCSRPTNHVAQSCNGRSSCAVKASNSIFGDPCYGTFKYLEVFYTCQKTEKK